MRCSVRGWPLRWIGLGVFAALVSPVAVVANDFCLLSDNRAALAARADLIQHAEREICVAYYAIDSSDAPLGLISLLCDAAGRGVSVRVLIDGLQSRLPSDFESMLADRGVVFRAYHPPYEGRPGWLTRRLHSKLLLVDREAMVVGSRNLQDHHFGMDDVNYVDCDALMAGPVCRSAGEYFDCIWNSDHVRLATKSNSFGFDFVDNLKFGVTPVPLRQEQRRTKYRQALSRGRRSLAKAIGGKDFTAAWRHVCCATNVRACLIHDQGPDKSGRCLQKRIVALIDSASESVHIETAYPVFSKPVYQAIERASARGASVSLLTNSLESVDVVSTYSAYQNSKAELLAMGVELYELCGSDHLHVKSMVVDRRTAMIGSYNFDVRSDRLNLELCLVVRDSRVAHSILCDRHGRVCRSEHVTRDRLLPEVAGDASPLRRTRMRVSQAVVPLYRRSL